MNDFIWEYGVVRHSSVLLCHKQQPYHNTTGRDFYAKPAMLAVKCQSSVYVQLALATH